jgi:hypothetical protein
MRRSADASEQVNTSAGWYHSGGRRMCNLTEAGDDAVNKIEAPSGHLANLITAISLGLVKRAVGEVD